MRVVEYGNFSRTAKALNLTPSAISKLVSRLEYRLGVTLFLRSNQGLQLTAEGQVYFDRAQQIVSEIEQSERAVVASAQSARGKLRINSNIPFAQHFLIPLLPDFLKRYPDITVDLVQTDMSIDLIYERADIAIRTGHLPDSSLKARKLLDSPRHVVASPDYIAAYGRPSNPAELASHNCLNFNLHRGLDIWPFDGSRIGQPARLDQSVKGNIRVDNGETMRNFCVAGLGIARLSDFHIASDLNAGRLVPLLEEYNPGDTEPVQALYMGHAHMANRIRVFLDFLVTNLKNKTTNSKFD